jgi:GTP cyclohydrolase II
MLMNLDNTQDRATDSVTVKLEAEANLPTEFGRFKIIGFRSTISDEEFVALIGEKIDAARPTLVRIHSQCLTSDVFHSLKCDCGPQLKRAMEMIQAEGAASSFTSNRRDAASVSSIRFVLTPCRIRALTRLKPMSNWASRLMRANTINAPTSSNNWPCAGRA